MIINASPILTTLLDTDAYKLHMQQAVFHHYPDVNVNAVFQSREGGLSARYLQEIQKEVEQMSSLALTEEEYHYLENLLFFKPDYLNWLKHFRFDPKQIKIRQEGEHLAIGITGPWREVILWEVPLLAVISEIVHRDRSPDMGVETALNRLQEKIHGFTHLGRDLDLSHFRLVDFGTRRRFSREVHHAIVRMLKADFPYIAGTSNYHLARQFHLLPVGTMAHEWFQAHQQICSILVESRRMALQVWLDEYPDKLGIALTDCISMEAFLRDLDGNFAQRYQGLRHDSGDPIVWGEKALNHYEKLGIDPQTKTLVFSDHLDFAKAMHIYRHFSHRTRLIFGMGTRLTCDLPHVTPLNMVIKLVKCNGRPVAKLSDTPGKTVSGDPVFTRVLREVFGI